MALVALGVGEPVVQDGPPNLLQTAGVQLAADALTNATTFVALLTVPITTTVGGVLVIDASFAASVSLIAPSLAFFRVVLDGVPLEGSGMLLSTLAQQQGGGFALRVTAVAPGAHTVVLEWRGSLINLGLQIRPVTAPDAEHASLVVWESRV